MDRQFVLVLGAPRSGTTLLTAMIGRHGEVAMLNEEFRWAVGNLIGKPVVGNKLCIPNQIELRQRGSWWRRKLQRRGFFSHGPEAELSIEDYLQTWKPLKIIAIMRDGEAVVSSIMKRGEQSQEVATYRWCRSIEIIDELRRSYPEQLLLLSFEQLVSEPEAAMRAVASYLDLAYQPEMLEGYAFTPLYSNSGIDPDKAEKRPTQNAPIDLRTRCPEAYARYEALLQQCAAAERQDVS